MSEKSKETWNLPLSVVTITDVSRLLREADDLDSFLQQVKIRKSGTTMTLPKLSQALEDFTKQNKLNLLNEKDRTKTHEYLKTTKEHAPVIHISFSSNAPATFLSKLIDWFRKEIHPQLLLQIGLQPSIAAGCVLRTPNKYFDLSLRQHISQNSDLLADKLKKALK